MPLLFPGNRTAMKILIVRLSSMGDVILATALFSFLRKQHPTASLTFLTGSDYAGLFRDDPRLSEAAGIDDSAVELPAPLAASAWDLVIDLQNSGRSRALLGQLRTGSRTAFFDKQHFQRFVLLFLRYNLYDFSRHVAARYIRAAGGDPSPGEVSVSRLFFEDAGCLKARETFGVTEPAALALFPFSAWKNKEWPESFFVKVGRYFTDKGWTVAIFGGPPDAERARHMKERIGGRCVSLAGEVSLYECGCLLKNFTLALGNDTGYRTLHARAGSRQGSFSGRRHAISVFSLTENPHSGFLKNSSAAGRAMHTAETCACASPVPV